MIAWTFARYKREVATLLIYVALLGTVAIVAPSFYSIANFRDLALNNVAILLIAVGMTLVIIVGQIDISVGSQFAVCSVITGELAKAGVPVPLVLPCVLAVGSAMGGLNGLLIGRVRLPSIIVTLAMFVAWRDALQWATGGAWVQGLPSDFQWFGLDRDVAQGLMVGVAVGIVVAGIWVLRTLAMGRMVYAVGSDPEAARLVGIESSNVVLAVFVVTGVLVGLAAFFNTVRFTAVPTKSGTGFELTTIAAVVVGGTAITGGRGTMVGTVIGVALLGTIGTALTFMGLSPFWEKAIQGAIILAAVGGEVILQRLAYPVGRALSPNPIATNV